jgi:CheY-like chemotaxis protein
VNVTPRDRALIVDHDVDILALLASRLRDEDSVETATSGLEALERMEGAVDLSLVLVDMAVADSGAFSAKLLDDRASISSHVFITATRPSKDAGVLPRVIEREAFYKVK